MARQRLDLHEGDVVVLARALGTDSDSLLDDIERRPRYIDEILCRQEVVESVLYGTDAAHLAISPVLFFAVLVHHSAHELSTSEWVDDWVGPGCRLPVFDVEPLLEFTDAPGRLRFTAELLAGFAVPVEAPVPVDRLDLDGLVDWLSAVEPPDRIVLLRQLGDLALFQAGVFPDSTGASTLSAEQAERLGRSVQMTDDELGHLVDHGSSTPGLDSLETLSAAWYRAAADGSPSTPVLVRDMAHRIRAARRFLNYVADRYLHRVQSGWAFGA